MAERIKEAREFGDISENSSTTTPKRAGDAEKQIADLEEKLRTRGYDQNDVYTGVVSVGVVVHVRTADRQSTKFKIVGSAEADPSESRLSNQSPVGRALLGHSRGETVSVPVPARSGP